MPVLRIAVANCVACPEVLTLKKRMAHTAMQGQSEPFSHLLPAGATSNLVKYKRLAQEFLQAGKEIGCNLDQNPDAMPHWGTSLPVILASVTNMYCLAANRPLTAKAFAGMRRVIVLFPMIDVNLAVDHKPWRCGIISCHCVSHSERSNACCVNMISYAGATCWTRSADLRKTLEDGWFQQSAVEC